MTIKYGEKAGLFNKKFDYTPMTPKESIRYVKKELGIQ
jgi:hypothetical protein